VRPVNEVSLGIAAGEAVGLVGESGSGKTMLSLALMGLLPQDSRVSGKIDFGGNRLERLNERQWQSVRGREIAMIFQEPMTSSANRNASRLFPRFATLARGTPRAACWSKRKAPGNSSGPFLFSKGLN
jgi:ABC-type oligopeptide transport system ATPase subunit